MGSQWRHRGGSLSQWPCFDAAGGRGTVHLRRKFIAGGELAPKSPNQTFIAESSQDTKTAPIAPRIKMVAH